MYESHEKMNFADIHSHLLFGVDDGARDEDVMKNMIKAAYDEGIRYLCLTPHYHKGYYGNNADSADKAYKILEDYCAEHYPDIKLGIGNELHYAPEAIEWIKKGECRTICKTRYVLVDFRFSEDPKTIIDALHRILGIGYTPILAHAERYSRLGMKDITEIKQMGALIQNNSGSLMGAFGLSTRLKAWKMIKFYLSDFVSTDAHNTTTRPVEFALCYKKIVGKMGREYADHICRDHAVKLFFENQRR